MECKSVSSPTTPRKPRTRLQTNRSETTSTAKPVGRVAPSVRAPVCDTTEAPSRGRGSRGGRGSRRSRGHSAPGASRGARNQMDSSIVGAAPEGQGTSKTGAASATRARGQTSSSRVSKTRGATGSTARAKAPIAKPKASTAKSGTGKRQGRVAVLPSPSCSSSSYSEDINAIIDILTDGIRLAETFSMIAKDSESSSSCSCSDSSCADCS